MEGRRERKKRQTHEAIAQTAFRLFAERGFDAVTMADVALAADVAVTTVFNHFKTKEDLFFTAFAPPGLSLAERLREREPGESPVASVEQILAESFAQLEAPDTWPAEAVQNGRFRAVLDGSPALHARALTMFRKWQMESLKAVSAALVAPAEPDALAHMVAKQLLSLLESTTIETELRRRTGASPSEIVATVRPAAERACAMLAAGLGDYGVR